MRPTRGFAAVVVLVAGAAIVGLYAEAEGAGANVNLRVSGQAQVEKLSCGESSAPIEFEADRANSVSRGEGPEAQYVLEMKVRVRPLAGTGAGSASIYGEVGGEPGATLEVRRTRERGRPTFRWSTID